MVCKRVTQAWDWTMPSLTSMKGTVSPGDLPLKGAYENQHNVKEVPRAELGSVFDSKMASMAKLQMRMKSLRLKVTPHPANNARYTNALSADTFFRMKVLGRSRAVPHGIAPLPRVDDLCLDGLHDKLRGRCGFRARFTRNPNY